MSGFLSCTRASLAELPSNFCFLFLYKVNCNGNHAHVSVTPSLQRSCCMTELKNSQLPGRDWHSFQGTGSTGTMQTRNHFPTESDPGARGLLAFLNSPTQCFSETSIRNEECLDNAAVPKALWHSQALPPCPPAHTEWRLFFPPQTPA